MARKATKNNLCSRATITTDEKYVNENPTRSFSGSQNRAVLAKQHDNYVRWRQF